MGAAGTDGVGDLRRVKFDRCQHQFPALEQIQRLIVSEMVKVEQRAAAGDAEVRQKIAGGRVARADSENGRLRGRRRGCSDRADSFAAQQPIIEIRRDLSRSNGPRGLLRSSGQITRMLWK